MHLDDGFSKGDALIWIESSQEAHAKTHTLRIQKNPWKILRLKFFKNLNKKDVQILEESPELVTPKTTGQSI